MLAERWIRLLMQARAVDDMAERCDRLEQEMLMRDAGSSLDTRSKSTLKSSESTRGDGDA